EYSIDGVNFSDIGSFGDLAAGTYALTAKNDEGCVSEAASVTIDPQPATPGAPVVANTVQPTCDVATGSFTVTVVEGLEYSIDGVNFSDTGSFTGLATNNYEVVSRTHAGCLSPATTVTIDAQPETPAAPQKLNDINSCNTIVTLDANEGISPAAGTTIVWYDSATGGSLVINPVLNSFGTITYWAEAISGSGCVSSTRTSVTLTSTEVTAEVAGSYVLTCATTSVVLDATGTSTGP